MHKAYYLLVLSAVLLLASCTLPVPRTNLPMINGIVVSKTQDVSGIKMVVCVKEMFKYSRSNDKCVRKFYSITDSEGRFGFERMTKMEWPSPYTGYKSIEFVITAYKEDKLIAELVVETDQIIPNNMQARCYLQKDGMGECRLSTKVKGKIERAQITFKPEVLINNYNRGYMAHLSCVNLEDNIENGKVEFTLDDVREFLGSFHGKNVDFERFGTTLVYVEGEDIGPEFVKRGYCEIDNKYFSSLQYDEKEKYLK